MHANEAQNFGIEQMFISGNQKIQKASFKIGQFTNVYELLKLFSIE